MEEIVEQFLLKYKLSKKEIEIIASRCKNIPRLAKIICTRLSYVFNNLGVSKNVEELESYLSNILSIQKNGLNELDRRYLEYLSIVKRSSLQNIIINTRIDKETIMTEIEPYLIFLNLIKITSKGREYV
jgi:Holliday junction resolvasome RuvABC ATP-dependent DNA helicase subunit